MPKDLFCVLYPESPLGKAFSFADNLGMDRSEAMQYLERALEIDDGCCMQRACAWLAGQGLLPPEFVEQSAKSWTFMQKQACAAVMASLDPGALDRANGGVDLLKACFVQSLCAADRIAVVLVSTALFQTGRDQAFIENCAGEARHLLENIDYWSVRDEALANAAAMGDLSRLATACAEKKALDKSSAQGRGIKAKQGL